MSEDPCSYSPDTPVSHTCIHADDSKGSHDSLTCLTMCLSRTSNLREVEACVLEGQMGYNHRGIATG